MNQALWQENGNNRSSISSSSACNVSEVLVPDFGLVFQSICRYLRLSEFVVRVVSNSFLPSMKPLEKGPAEHSSQLHSKAGLPELTNIHRALAFREPWALAPGGIRKVVWSVDGRRLASTMNADICIWNARVGCVAQILGGAGPDLIDLDWSADGESMVSLSQVEGLIDSIPAALILVGKHSMGPRQEQEYFAFLNRYVRNRGRQSNHLVLVPVLLPSAGSEPELPAFLRSFSYIDFRKAGLKNPELIRLLVQSIYAKGTFRNITSSPNEYRLTEEISK